MSAALPSTKLCRSSGLENPEQDVIAKILFDSRFGH
jgi:hypothetical protein